MMLNIRNISANFGSFALQNIDLSVRKGEYFILLGPSGAGKSLLLETIAGLIHPDQGSIYLNEENITNKPVQQRSIGIVFQDHAIFPHLTIRQNIGYALRHLGKDESEALISATAARLSVSSLLNRRPSTLSGGEMQRVALARTLVRKPVLLLLDEPLASIDSALRAEARHLLRQLHREGQTILHVTHDYEEALALGTSIAVMDKGVLLQTGTPEEIFHHPANPFIASFVGVRNFFEATVSVDETGTIARTSLGLVMRLGPGVGPGTGYLLLRGEDIFLSAGEVSTSAANNFRGRVTEVSHTPYGVNVSVDAGEILHALVTGATLQQMGITIGMSLWVHCKATAVRFIPT